MLWRPTGGGGGGGGGGAIFWGRKSSVNVPLPFLKQALVFISLQYRSFEITVGEKEKLLVTSNFFIPHGVFYQFRELSAIFIRSEINPLPHMPILGSSDSAASKDMMSEI